MSRLSKRIGHFLWNSFVAEEMGIERWLVALREVNQPCEEESLKTTSLNYYRITWEAAQC